MLENDEKLKSPKEQNNESLADSKKIDLYINNSDADAEQGISILNVFSTLRQRFHIYIWVILLGLIAGLLVPVMMYEFKDKKEDAITVIAMDYEGASEGKAPDGTELDITYLKSSYVVQKALSKVVLSKNVSTAQVQSNLTIKGILTDDTKQMQEILDKLLEEKSSNYGKLLVEFTLRYRPQYIVTLSNIFKDGNSKFALSASDTNKLLNAITIAYNEYFVDTYQQKILPSDYIGAIDTQTKDYLDILDDVSDSLKYLERYCDEKAAMYPYFRSASGLSFDDLSTTIDTISNTDIDYIYSYIYLNNVSKDPYTQLTNYRYQKREATLQLNEINATIETIQNSIDNYKPDKIVVSSPDGNTVTTVDRTSDYYNALVNSIIAANEEKSAVTQRISILDYRIEKLEGTPATDEQVAKAETYVNSALVSAKNLYSLVRDSSAELFDSNAYNNKYMHTITTSESEGLSSTLKQVGIGVALGGALGLIVWIADAFILEFRRVKRVNEEREAR